VKLKSSPQVAAIAEPGNYPVEGVAGLFLQVRARRAGGVRKSWVLRFRRAGRRRMMGLGPYPTISLQEAQRRANKARVGLVDGVDPIAARRPAVGALTFEEASGRFISSHKRGWGERSTTAWTSSLRNHAYPVLGKMDVKTITLGDVVRVLERLWSAKPTTAGKLRGRIEAVLDWCRVEGYRPEGPNPAAWKGNLEHRLPPLARVQDVEHHVAVPWRDAPKVYRALGADRSSHRMLRFIMLTAARYGEVAQMQWEDIDLKAAVWTVPVEALKSRREHRVPLCDEALAILKAQAGERAMKGLVFRGTVPNKPVSDQTLRKLLREVSGIGDADVHGLRSTFRDWCADTKRSREAAELSLAHVIAGGAEAAYWRSDLLEERGELLSEWAQFLRV
jgi:integrase